MPQSTQGLGWAIFFPALFCPHHTDSLGFHHKLPTILDSVSFLHICQTHQFAWTHSPGASCSYLLVELSQSLLVLPQLALSTSMW